MIRGKKRKMSLIVSLAIGCSLIGVGGTVAWLQAKQDVTNTFQVAAVTGEIDEDFNKVIKKDVAFTNTNESNIPVYIRVRLVPTWMNKDKTATGLTVEGTYDLSLATENWFKKGDFYYYTQPVAPGARTKDLIKSCKVKEGLKGAYKGKQLQFEVIAQYIQAEGVTSAGVPAVTDAWGITVKDGILKQ